MPKILGGVVAHEILHLGSTLLDLGLGLLTLIWIYASEI